MPLELLRVVSWEDKPWYGTGALVLATLLAWRSSRCSHPTPPGPRKLPVVGSILSMPTTRQWEVLRDWKAIYGDLIYLEGLGKKILAVNSYPLAQTLLANRAANYSDRGWTPLGEMKNFREDIKLLFGAIIMRVSYGRDDLEYNKQLIKEGQKFGEDYMEPTLPGRLLVTTFPFLKHLPSWVPGTGWKSVIGTLRQSCSRVRSKAYVELKDRLEGIQGDYNVAEQLISTLPNEDDPAYQYEDDIARNVAAISFLAGADTTISSGVALILALAMHPEVQRKAQEELDTVVGPEGVPSLEDVDQLPYIQAIVKEVSRWHTVLPYGVPHVATEEDNLNGYRIPAGTMILTNSWAFMHDPAVFEDPMEYKPERYLKDGKRNPNVLDPMDVAFGYGRRICPGRHLSNASLTMMAASLLAFFDVKQSIGADGNPIPLKYGVKSESILFSFPAEFDCDIVPRSARHAQVVQALEP
ncbi:cytochrome P450 [Coprinopsis sp. MPI-PUGE-AT-0042]|nr:cytochrome P450 [Coprinopsis sp. MPI-PUGE-AT-0042]